MMKKWIVLTLVLMLAVLPAALAEGLEIEEEPVIEESEDVVLSEDVDNIAEEEDFMLFSDEPVEKGYADFLTEGAENPSSVAIDVAHFPDEIFRNTIKENFDTDGDGVLSEDELAAVKRIDVYNKGVTTMQGVKLFPNLTTLYCDKNQFTSLDLSGCTSLETLSCVEGGLTSLNLSGCTALTGCSCYRNQLATINLTGCVALVNLSCFRNPLTSLDLSACLALEKLDCGDSQLTSLNVRMCKSLTNLTCGGGPLTTLDVRGCTALKWLICTNAQLTSLNASGCVNLSKLEVTTNQLTSLDLSEFDDLYDLHCAGNQLATLDVRGKTNLMTLVCHANPLTELDLSGCSYRMHNCAAATPKLYDEGTDHEYFWHKAGTGEQLIVDRDVKLVFDGNVIYDPPLLSKCTITGIGDQVYVPYGTYPEFTIMDGDKRLVWGTDYKSRYENAYNVGTATITLWGIGRYTGVVERNYRILQCPIKEAKIEDIPDQAWTGSAIEPEIKVTHKGTNTTRTLRLGDDYTVAYSNNVNAGTATVTVTGIGNYKGTTTAHFTIVRDEPPSEPIPISDCKITVKAQVYTGKALKPSVTVKYNGTKLVKGTDYTVSYKNNTKVGTATVTVKGIGNYTGSKKATFKINPKGTTISKVSPGKKKLTVTWKKQTKQVSGYQIQYGTKKDFSNAKKVTVSGAKTVKKVIKSLKAKKYYYVRIRTYKTVSGKKYYSSWSKYKKIKTK